jgi:transcriptional regulator with GAF, ATPase, and Fis domain
VRLIAATHRDIKRLVGEGKFREDLYYRLAGYEIAVPPLRERASDIPLLVDFFRHRIAEEMKRPLIPGPSQSVLDVFAEHGWPGNVRELEQVTRRIVIDSGALLDAAAASSALRDIAPSVSGASVSPAPATEAVSEDLISLDEAEKRHIITVLRATGGNQTQAAYILGIERKTLARMMKRLDISLEP